MDGDKCLKYTYFEDIKNSLTFAKDVRQDIKLVIIKNIIILIS